MNGLLSSVSEPKGLNLQTRPEGYFPWKPQRDVRRRLGIPLTPEEEAEIASAEAVDLPDDPNLTPEENEELKQSAIAVIQNKALAEAEAEYAIKLGEVSATKDPAKLEQFRKEGYELSEEQQRILWDVENAKPLTQKAGEFVSAIGPAAASMVTDLGKGAYALTKETADIAGATGESEEYAGKQFEEAGQAWRSFGSGVIGGLEDIVVNLPKTMIAGGTPITDYIAEQFGRSPDVSFQNFLAREDVRRQLAEEQQKYPERTSRMLQRLGETFGWDQFAENVGKNALTRDQINPNIAVLGDVLAFDVPFTSALSKVAAKPVTRGAEALGGAVVGRELAGVRLGLAPTLQATGYGIRRGGEKIDEIAGKIDQYFTGSPDWLFRNAVGKTARLVTKPAAAVEAVGELGVDIGRATDLGWAGRKGVFERIGTSPDSGVIANTLFGDRSKLSLRKIGPMTPEEVARNAERLGSQLEKNSRAGLQRARALDAASRLTQYYANSGISGAAVQAMLGLPNLETWGAAGEMVGSGIGIGAVSASAPGALFGTRVAMDQRRAAEADIRRMYETLDEKTKKDLADLGNPEQFIQTSEGRLAFLQMRKELLEEIIKSGQNYQQGDVNMTPQDAETELFEINENIIPRIEGEIDAVRKGGKRAAEEVQFLINKEFMDTLGNLKMTADKAGLGGDVNVQISSTEEIAAALREMYAPYVKTATETVQALEGQQNISPDDAARLQDAKEFLQFVDQEINTNSQTRGFALNSTVDRSQLGWWKNYAPVNVPTIFVNRDLLKEAQGMDLSRTLRHEMFHALLQFSEVQDLVKPYTDRLFDQYTIDINGNRVKIEDGLISDQALMAMAQNYASLYDPLDKARWFERYNNDDEAIKNAIKEEVLAELFNFSGGEMGMTSQIEDSVFQNFVDIVKTKESNSTIGRIRDALAKLGIETTDDGVVSDVLGELPSEAVSLIRQLRRELRDNSGAFTREGDPNLNTTGSLTFAKIAASPALRKQYANADFWAQEAATTIYGPDGKVVRDVVLNKRQADAAKVGEWVVQNGILTPVDPETGPAPRNLMVAAKGQPDGTKIVVGIRTAKDAEGNPKILSSSAIEAASRQRGRMIRDAIDNAPDDGSPNRLRDTGNGNYRGTMSPSQIQAIKEIPDIVLPPAMKRYIVKINDALARGDGVRHTIEYQAALRGGKYRAMAPRISDEVFIGFQFSKQDNFLVTSVSVTRLNNKIDSWLKNKPQRLSLWGGSKYDMWVDFKRYLANHQQGLPGDTNLSTDPVIAEAKKNVLNDLLNLYNKETEGANPDRTVSKTRRGQDSVDRTIASRRLDRMLQLEQNTGDKLPLNYGKITSNALPASPSKVEDVWSGKLKEPTGPQTKFKEEKSRKMAYSKNIPGRWSLDLFSNMTPKLSKRLEKYTKQKFGEPMRLTRISQHGPTRKLFGPNSVGEVFSLKPGVESFTKNQISDEESLKSFKYTLWGDDKIPATVFIVDAKEGLDAYDLGEHLNYESYSEIMQDYIQDFEKYANEEGEVLLSGQFKVMDVKDSGDDRIVLLKQMPSNTKTSNLATKFLPEAPQGKGTYFRFFDQHQRGTSTKIGEFMVKVEAESPEDADRLIKKSPEYIAAAARSNVIPTSEVEMLPPEDDLWRPEGDKPTGGPGSKALPDIANRSDLEKSVSGVLSLKGVRDPNIKDWFLNSYVKDFLQASLEEVKANTPMGWYDPPQRAVGNRANLYDYEAQESDPEWMKKEGLQRFVSLTETERDWISHVVDYMNSLPESERKKLYKQTRSQIDEKVVQWSEEMANKSIKAVKYFEEGKDVRPVKKFADGYSVVELLSDNAYEEEGDGMGHCVGDYCNTRPGGEDYSRNPYRKIYSLRDKKGFPHATIEVITDLDKFIEDEFETQLEIYFGENGEEAPDWQRDRILDEVTQDIYGDISPYAYAESDKRAVVLQIKGKANKPVNEKYAKYVREFFRSPIGRKMAIMADGANIGLKEPDTSFIDPSSSQAIANPDATLEDQDRLDRWEAGDRYEVPPESEFPESGKKSPPSSKALPAAIAGTFYHATSPYTAMRLARGAKFQARGYGTYKDVKVVYVAPSKAGAEGFGEEVIQTKLKSNKIFNPNDPDDIMKILDVFPNFIADENSWMDEKEIYKEASKQAKYISDEGRDKDSGWEAVEEYADVIKDAGFDGYIAWEDGQPMIGFFEERIPYQFEEIPEPPLGNVAFSKDEIYKPKASKALPAALSGAFYHGTRKKKLEGLGKRGKRSGANMLMNVVNPKTGKTYPFVELTFVSPNFAMAEGFGDKIFKGELKNRNIFDPSDKDDIAAVVNKYFELSPDDSFEREEIRDMLKDGKNKQEGWMQLESFATVIKEAGFDGFLAWEGGTASLGVFPDRIDLSKFKETSPRKSNRSGSVKSIGLGNVDYSKWDPKDKKKYLASEPWDPLIQSMKSHPMWEEISNQ